MGPMRHVHISTKARINIILYGILIGLISRSKKYKIDNKKTSDSVVKLLTNVILITIKVRNIAFVCAVLVIFYHLLKMIPA